MADAKKVANNILDFLIDPTKIPVKERVYFGPEEMLKNEYYEKAKADAQAAFKDQKFNSDFYPNKKNRPLTREAHIMDRKSLIASLDILSRNFKESSDPIAADLQNMAIAISKMDDEALQARLASDAPDLETVVAAKTFKCPDCGTNVLQQTGYCVKCKKKVKQAEDSSEEKVEEKEEKDAMLMPGQKTDIGERMPGSSAMPGGPKIKSVYDQNKAEIKKTPWLKNLFEGLGMKTAEESKEEVKEEEKDAMLTTPGQHEIGIRQPGSSAQPGGGKIKSLYDQNKVEIEKKPWLKDLFQGLMGKRASENFWTKEASDIIARTLVADIIGITADDKEDDEKPAAEPVVEKEKEEPKEAKAEEKVEPKAEEPKTEEPKVEEPKEAKQAKVEPKVEDKVEPKVEEPKEGAKVVDTDVLASYNFAGIEVPVNFVDEAGEMSAEEKANLARLF